MRSVYEQIDKVHSDALSFDAIVPLKQEQKESSRSSIDGKCKYIRIRVWR